MYSLCLSNRIATIGMSVFLSFIYLLDSAGGSCISGLLVRQQLVTRIRIRIHYSCQSRGCWRARTNRARTNNVPTLAQPTLGIATKQTQQRPQYCAIAASCSAPVSSAATLLHGRRVAQGLHHWGQWHISHSRARRMRVMGLSCRRNTATNLLC